MTTEEINTIIQKTEELKQCVERMEKNYKFVHTFMDKSQQEIQNLSTQETIDHDLEKLNAYLDHLNCDKEIDAFFRLTKEYASMSASHAQELYDPCPPPWWLPLQF